MSVELEPAELGFRRPFTNEVTQVLRITNPNREAVGFKVKTTAPRQYCVRPNSGRIEPGGDTEVQVLLQAMKEDPPLDARCRDKFLVQSFAIEDGQGASGDSALWNSMDKVPKENIKEKKIRVTFLPAHEGTNGTMINGSSIPDEAPPAYRSPSPTSVSPGPQTAHEFNREYETPTRGNESSTISNVYDTAASTVSATASAATKALQDQLANAEATIESLKTQIKEQGLRQRKSEAVTQDARERVTTGTTGMGVQTQPADGVSVQIVAALCLLSFLLAYFFF